MVQCWHIRDSKSGISSAAICATVQFEDTQVVKKLYTVIWYHSYGLTASMSKTYLGF